MVLEGGEARSLAHLGRGDHLCGIYKSGKEQRTLVTPFIRAGLQRGEKVVWIAESVSFHSLKGWLREDGVDPDCFVGENTLEFLTFDKACSGNGGFDPSGTIGFLEKTLAEGCAALRIAFEMNELADLGRLLEFEALLNRFLPGKKCMVLCQYDRRRFDARVLLRVLETHPLVVIGEEVFGNQFYLFPGDTTESNPEEALLDRRLKNLERRKRAEAALRESRGFLQSVIDGIPEMMMVIDSDYRVRLANLEAKGLASYLVKTIKTRGVRQLMKALSEGATFEDALADVARLTPKQIEDEWKSSLGL